MKRRLSAVLAVLLLFAFLHTPGRALSDDEAESFFPISMGTAELSDTEAEEPSVVLFQDTFVMTAYLTAQDASMDSVTPLSEGIEVLANVEVRQILCSNQLSTRVEVYCPDTRIQISGYTVTLRYTDMTDFTPSWWHSFPVTNSTPINYLSSTHNSVHSFPSGHEIGIRFDLTVDLANAIWGPDAGTISGIRYVTIL